MFVHGLKMCILSGFWFLGHLSYSGDLLLSVFVRRRAMCVVRRPLTFEHFRLLLWKGWTNFNQIWYIATMGKGEHKLWISWSLPPWGLRGGAKTIKISAIFKNLLLYSWTSCSQTVCMIVISNKPSTKIVKFMAPGSGVLELEEFKDHVLCTLTVHYCLLDYLPLIVFMLFCVCVWNIY